MQEKRAPMRTTVVLCSAFLGCGLPCETNCGLVSDTPLCSELSEQEAKVLRSFEVSVSQWSRAWTCDKLRGYEVKVDPESDGSQFPKEGEYILGYTDCRSEVKEIVTANQDWKINAFSHELGHVIEGCLGPPIVPVWHYGWEIRGINAAINNAVLGDTSP